MKQFLTFDDGVSRYESHEIFPTEWEYFPIHHTDPFWNAELFDKPQPRTQDFKVDGPAFTVYGDWASEDVRLRAYRSAGGLLLGIRDNRGRQSVWLEPRTLKAVQDFINTSELDNL